MSVVTSLLSYRATRKGQKQADAANQRAEALEAEARSESKAINSARAALERRQQVREERIARGKLMQGSANSGTSGSSGESGAQAGLANQLGANIGFNLGMIQATNNISDLNQGAANFQADARNALSKAQSKVNMFNTIRDIDKAAGSIFSGG